MYRLETLHAVQFYLMGAQSFHFGASSAIVAPNGSGKTAILDAIQVALLGGDTRAVDLNAQAGGSRDGRSVRDYCLGVYRDETRVRNAATTYLTLVFRDSTGEKPPVSCGIALGAAVDEPKLLIYGRYIVPGVELTLEDHLELKEDEPIPADWATFRQALMRQAKAAGQVAEVDFPSASRYVDALLFRLRAQSVRSVDRVGFAKAFKNAMNLKNIPDTSAFVRDRIAEERPLNLDRFREQLESFRALREQIARVIERIERGEAVHAVCARARHARMREASYRAMVAEYRRDIEQDALSTAEAIAERAEQTAAAAQRRTEAARDAEQAADRELRALLDESRNRAGVNDVDPEAEHRAVLGPIKSDLARTLRRIVSGLTPAGRLEPVQGAEPGQQVWSDLLERIEQARPGDALAIDVNRVLERLTGSVAQWPGRLQAVAHREREATDAVARLRRQLDLNRTSLQRAESGRADLGEETQTLQLLLESEGIRATAVCDLVEVAEPAWARAIEAYLRRNVQALLVEPGREEAAVAVYRRQPDSSGVFGAKIIQPGRSRSTFDAPDALACLIRGESPDAVEFLRARLGRLRQLDQPLLRGPDSLTKDGTLIQNGSLERLRLPMPDQVRLGRHDARARRDRLAREVKTLEQALGDALRIARQASDMQDALKPLSGADGVIEDLTTWLWAHAEHERRLAIIAATRNAQSDPDLVALQEAVTASHLRFETARAERSAADKALGRAQAACETAVSEVARLQARCEEEAARAVTACAAEFVDAGWIDSKRAQLEAKGEPLVDLVSYCEARAARDHREYALLESQARTDVGAYGATYGISLDFDPSDIDRAALMLEADVRRLRESELASYESQAQEAYQTAVRTFRSRIAAQLRTNFEDLKHQIRLLNSVLERSPPFTNNERYHFRADVDPVHAALHAFINQVADQHHDDLLEAHIETPEAFRALVEDAASASRSVLEDYRRFFVFDVEVRVDQRKVSTLDKRMASGSGGEHRAPLFVVAGAALAAAYGKSRGDRTGLSLILLDELGDKVDANNARAIFDYLDALGLQPIVAAPSHALNIVTDCLSDYTELFRADDILVVHHVDVNPPAQELLRSDSPAHHPDLVAREAAAIREAAGVP